MNISEKIIKEAKNYLGDAKSYLGKEAKNVKSRYCNCGTENTGTIAGALLIGAAVGAVIGLLFAPNKGSQTRSNIADSVKDLSYRASDKIKQGKEALSGVRSKSETASKNKGRTTSRQPKT